MKSKKSFALMVIFAFASVISFFLVNSAWADKANWNTKIIVVGIALGLVAVYFLIRVIKKSGSYTNGAD